MQSIATALPVRASVGKHSVRQDDQAERAFLTATMIGVVEAIRALEKAILVRNGRKGTRYGVRRRGLHPAILPDRTTVARIRYLW